MSADDLRHRARFTGGEASGGVDGQHVAAPADLSGWATVAARVPPEYRDAYLEGFARVRADRRDTAA